MHYPAGRSVPDLLAPPYDVISDADHRKLAKSHPHNIIHLTLGAPGRKTRDYAGIGHKLRRWLHDGVLMQDAAPAYYGYCQEFVHGGVVRKFWGLLGALKLEAFGTGKIFPHERVHAGPVDDRFKIMEGTRANLEPIIAMYRRPADPLTLLYESLEVLPPTISASYPNGGRHRLWALTSPRTRTMIQRALTRLPFFIADGHHRYHAAWLFRQRHKHRPEARWMMALVANTEQSGLKILPYHRIVTLESPLGAAAAAGCARFGRVERTGRTVPGFAHPLPRHSLGFFSKANGGWVVHLPALAAKTAARETLEVVRLNEVLPQIARIRSIVYTKDPVEAAQAAKKAPNVLAALLPPIASEQITKIAFGGDTLPQKSTFFIPKPASGLLLRLM